MNIFVLDTDQKKAAQMHNDKHVVKMILETAQLLCTVHHMTKSDEDRESIPYKINHKNHPCSIWARECKENYLWLQKFGEELFKEYVHRYGKYHKSYDVIKWCAENVPTLKENGSITEFKCAMPDECKVDNPVQSYRNYYRMYKQYWERKNKKTGEVDKIKHTWTKRETPQFMLITV